MASKSDHPRVAWRVGSDRGSALLLALMLIVLLAGLGVSTAMTSDVERKAAANAWHSNRALFAARGAIDRAISDLTTIASWTGVLTGAQQSAFADATLLAMSPSGEQLDLTAATAELQADSNAAGTFGPNTPVWRLFAWGPYAVLTSTSVTEVPEYVAVWTADDPSESDGNANMDTNGVLLLHAEAWGPGGGRRVVEATVARTTTAALRLISWREKTS
jgi:Tfp pilus assembly protein PilX